MQKKGFTLVELLIGAMIGAIILLSVYVAFNAAVKYWSKSNSATSAQQTARVASDHLSRNLKLATAAGTGGVSTFTLTADASSQFLTYTKSGVQARYQYDFPTAGGGGVLSFTPNIATTFAQPLTGANVIEGSVNVNAVRLMPAGTNAGIFTSDGATNHTTAENSVSCALVYVNFLAQDSSAASNSQTARAAQSIEIRTALTYPHL